MSPHSAIFSALPTEFILTIITYLDGTSIPLFQQTCRRFYHIPLPNEVDINSDAYASALWRDCLARLQFQDSEGRLPKNTVLCSKCAKALSKTTFTASELGASSAPRLCVGHTKVVRAPHTTHLCLEACRLIVRHRLDQPRYVCTNVSNFSFREKNLSSYYDPPVLVRVRGSQSPYEAMMKVNYAGHATLHYRIPLLSSNDPYLKQHHCTNDMLGQILNGCINGGTSADEKYICPHLSLSHPKVLKAIRELRPSIVERFKRLLRRGGRETENICGYDVRLNKHCLSKDCHTVFQVMLNPGHSASSLLSFEQKLSRVTIYVLRQLGDLRDANDPAWLAQAEFL